MFASIKLRSICIAVAIAVLVVGICGALTITAGAKMDNGLTVVLDAGHGGQDGGVSGIVTGTKESDINLIVTKAVSDFLSKAGYNVILTRKNSEGLYGATDKNKKLADMKKRKEIIEKAQPDLVVSIHQNYYPLQSVRGAQVFFDISSQVSKDYAAKIQNTINSGIGGTRVPMRGDYYILQCSKYPSVLVECGFLSNPEEDSLLTSAEYQQRIAYLIFSGIHGVLSDGISNYDYLHNT